ncbi:MAG: hypothetical protein R3B09_34830 [Nannocystaceae bacterium]
MEPGEGDAEAPALVLVAPQRRLHPPRGAGALEGLLDRELERRVGRELDEGGRPVGDQALDHRREADLLGEVPAPVLGVELGALEDRPDRGRVDREGRRGRGQGRQLRPQVGEHRRDQGGVGGRRGVDEAAEDPLGLERGHQRPQGLDRAGDHRRPGAVAGGDEEALGVALEGGEGGGPEGLGEEHPGGRGAHPLAEEAAADRDHPHRRGDVEGPGDAGRRDLAEAVADDRAGLHPVGPPERRQADLEGAEDRLEDVDRADPGGVAAADGLEDREGRVGPEGGVAGLDRRPEDRLGRQQPAAHPRPLAALAGEHEDHPIGAGALGDPGDRLRARGALGEGGEAGRELRDALADDRQAVREVGSAGAGGVQEVGERQIGAGGEEVAPAERLGPQRLARAGRHREDHRRPRGVRSLVGGLLRLGARRRVCGRGVTGAVRRGAGERGVGFVCPIGQIPR